MRIRSDASVRRRPPDTTPSSAWILYLVAGAVAIYGYYSLPRAGVGQAVVLTTLNATATAAGFLAAVRTRGSTRVVWISLGAAMFFATAANGPYYAFPLITGRHVPFPCALDVLFLLTYPCFVIALTGLVRQRRRIDRRGDALDAAILVVGGGSLMWQFVLAPVVHAAGLPVIAHIVAVSYPVMDLIVFAMLVRLVVAMSGRNAALRILLTSFIALLAADVVYAMQLSRGVYSVGGPVDGLWMMSYVFIGVAALHPAAGSLSRRVSPPASSRHRVSAGRLGFVSASVLTGPLVFAVNPDGSRFIAAVTALSFLLVMARMTGLNRQLAAVSRELETRASTDSLTGLANRDTFRSRLEEALAATLTVPAGLAVLFVDVDDFKFVNDSLGHAAGDELLQAVAARLERAVRPKDLVARLGGDEFGIILETTSDADALDVANRIVGLLSEPAGTAGRVSRVAASVGLATSRSDSDAKTLMLEADVAMYSAKSRGKSRVEQYDANLHQAVVEDLALAGEMLGAVERDEFVLDYQPVVDLESGWLVGVEALVRWQHPCRGLLPPTAFIGIAEGNGAIKSLGSWVLETAARQVAIWQRRDARSNLSLSVNASMHQLEDPAFADLVEDVCQRTRLDPTTLVIEVTESVLADGSTRAAATLSSLRALGVRIALDDFGTGYSSIGYLHALPVDILKIDRSFVAGEQGDQANDVILETIVDLGSRLGLDVLPEGIENVGQLERLRALGCRTGQGFLLSRPVSPCAVETLLTTSRCLLPLAMTPQLSMVAVPS